MPHDLVLALGAVVPGVVAWVPAPGAQGVLVDQQRLGEAPVAFGPGEVLGGLGAPGAGGAQGQDQARAFSGLLGEKGAGITGSPAFAWKLAVSSDPSWMAPNGLPCRARSWSMVTLVATVRSV